MLYVLSLLTILIIVVFYNRCKKAETALQKSDQFHHTLYENAGVGIIYIDKDGKVIKANDHFLNFVGHKLDELEQLNITEIFQPDDTTSSTTILANSNPGTLPNSIRFEKHYIRKDGDIRWADISLSTIYDLNGAIEAQIATISDLTERKQAEEALRRSDVLERLASGASLSDILTALVLNAEKHNHDMICSVLLLDIDGKHLRFGAAPSLPEFYNRAIDGVEIGTSMGSCAAAAYTGHRVIVEQIDNHPHWNGILPLAKQAGLAACWSEPVVSSNGSILGTFAIYYREPRSPEQRDLDFIQDSARLAGVAIERKQAEEKTLELLQQNRELTQSLFQIQEQERHHLSRELHDELGQWLTAIQLNAKYLNQHVSEHSTDIDSSIESITQSTQQIHNTIRNMIRSLRPALLDELGLADSLHEKVNQYMQNNPDIDCHLSLEGDLANLGEDLNITIYRLIQEGLTNISKHAEADHVVIKLLRQQADKENDESIILTIEDNGKGFDPNTQTTGVGIAGMRERVLASGGKFLVESSPKNGVRIKCQLFIKQYK